MIPKDKLAPYLIARGRQHLLSQLESLEHRIGLYQDMTLSNMERLVELRKCYNDLLADISALILEDLNPNPNPK